MAEDSVSGSNDQMINRMATWPKWATEESINSLRTTVASGNKRIADLTAQVIQLMKSQKNTGQDAPRSQAQVQSQTAKVKQTTAPPRPNDLFNQKLLRSLSEGMGAMSAQQARSNALLSNINQNMGSLVKNSTRKRTRQPGENSGTHETFVPPTNQNINRKARAQADDMASTLGGNSAHRNGNRQQTNGQKAHDYFNAHEHLNLENRSKEARQFMTSQSKLKTGEGVDNTRAARALANDLRTKYGKVMHDAARDFEKDIHEASGDATKLGQAFEKVAGKIESNEVRTARRPDESVKEHAARLRSVAAEKYLGKDAAEHVAGGGGIVEALGLGALGKLLKNPALAAFAPEIAVATVALEGLYEGAKKLFTLWKDNAVRNTEALSSGLVGLTTTVLNQAVVAKSAGLSLEQFSKAVKDANGSAVLLDTNAMDAGKTFGDGIKPFLDLADKANFWGQSLDDLMKNYSRVANKVALSGLKDAQAKEAIVKAAEQESKQMLVMANQTGKSVSDLNDKLNSLYKSDIFRVTTSKMLGTANAAAAKDVQNFAEALQAAGSTLGPDLADSMSLAIKAGLSPEQAIQFNPKLMDFYTSGGQDVLQSVFDAQKEAQSKGQTLSKNDIIQILSQKSNEYLNGPNGQSAAGFALAGGRGSIGFDTYQEMARLSENRQNQVNPEQAVRTPGAEAGAAKTRGERTMNQVEGKVLEAIDASHIMDGFTNLANAASAITKSFLELNPLLQALIVLLGGLALLKGGSMARGAISRRLGGAAANAAEGVAAGEAANGARAAANAAEGVAAEGAVAGAPKGGIAGAWEKVKNWATGKPAEVKTTEPAKPAEVNTTEPAKPAEVKTTEPAEVKTTEPAKPAEVNTTEPVEPAKPVPQAGEVNTTEPAKPVPQAGEVNTTEPAKPVEPNAPKPPPEPAKPVEPNAPKPPPEPAKPVPQAGEVNTKLPVGEPPKPPVGEGSASKLSAAAAGVKGALKAVPEGAAIGALIDLGVNEFTEIPELKKAREDVIAKYKKGEISRSDAENAIAAIDDRIAESRGGTGARGAVAGAGGVLGGAAGGIAGLGVASAPVGIAGAIGGSMIADKLLGGAAESAGGWLSKKLFGASKSGISKELDNARPLDDKSGPKPQPGALQQSSSGIKVAGKDVVQGQPLTSDQMAAIDMALQMSPDNAKNYPDWVLAQYKKQKGSSSAVPAGAAGAALSMNNTGANVANAVSSTMVNGKPVTPSGVTGGGIPPAVGSAAAMAAQQNSQDKSQVASAVSDVSSTPNDTLIKLQQQNNQLLARLVASTENVSDDSRRQVDLLENINNKT